MIQEQAALDFPESVAINYRAPSGGSNARITFSVPVNAACFLRSGLIVGGEALCTPRYVGKPISKRKGSGEQARVK
jgi:hypothetical protein